jgi:hypothetical protein
MRETEMKEEEELKKHETLTKRDKELRICEK